MARIDDLLVRMAEANASDLHLTSDHPPMMRVHGDMTRLEGEDLLESEEIAALLAEILPERSRAELEEKNDADFAYEVEDLARFRVNAFYDRNGIAVVMRLIPSEVLTLEDLDMPASVRDLCYLSKGLVLVTGPTGSGKSTTLAAMIDHINRVRREHIVTIEDPVEYVHHSRRCLVNQREVGVHAFSFQRALRAALREDPDIVLIGEMRDLETIHTALETAETGHLVFGTVHTTTAASTVDRVIDQFPVGRQPQIRTMLSNTLKAVIAQTLLRRQDGEGRVAALEVLIVTSAIAAHIREGKTHAIGSAIQTGRKHGMISLNDAILRHVRDGTVAPEEAYLKAVDKREIQARMAQLGIDFDPSNLSRAEVEADPEDGDAEPVERREPARLVRSRRAVFDDFESFRQARMPQ